MNVGSLSLFSGSADSGQPVFLAEWAHHWQHGLPINGHATNKPKGVLHIITHHAWDPFYSKLYRRLGVDVAHLTVVDDYDQSAKTWEDNTGLDRFEEILGTCDDRYDLEEWVIYVDKASPSLMRGNPCHPAHAGQSMSFYRELAHRYCCTMILLLGAAKVRADGSNRYARGRERFYGSAELGEHADLNMWLDDEKEPVTFGWKVFNEPEWTCSFRRDQETGLFTPAVGDEGPTKATDRPSQLLDLIPDDGIRYMELVRRAALHFGVSQKTIKRDIDVLRERMLVHGEAGRLRRRKLA
jgi:hypothetical protein